MVEEVEYLGANCEIGLHSTTNLQEHVEFCDRDEGNELIFIPNYSQEVVITQVEEEKTTPETNKPDENIYCATLLFDF